MKINIVYRTCNAPLKETALNYINKERCLSNAIKNFPRDKCNWHIVADTMPETSIEVLKKYVDDEGIEKIYVKDNSKSFTACLNYALSLKTEEWVYFLEDDYLHRNNSFQVLNEGILLSESYVKENIKFLTLYDHPDKYGYNGPNPFVSGGEITKVYLTNSCHWKYTNSTTMTFASKVSTLLKHQEIIRKYAISGTTYAFKMFLELNQKKEYLISPLPGYSTHGTKRFPSPLYNWEKEVR